MRVTELHAGEAPSSTAGWCDYYRALAEVEDSIAALFAEARKAVDTSSFQWWAYYEAQQLHELGAKNARDGLARNEPDPAVLAVLTTAGA